MSTLALSDLLDNSLAKSYVRIAGSLDALRLGEQPFAGFRDFFDAVSAGPSVGKEFLRIYNEGFGAFSSLASPSPWAGIGKEFLSALAQPSYSSGVSFAKHLADAWLGPLQASLAAANSMSGVISAAQRTFETAFSTARISESVASYQTKIPSQPSPGSDASNSSTPDGGPFSSDNLRAAVLARRLPAAPSPKQIQLNVKARKDLVDEFGVFTSSDISQCAGSRSRNRSALPNSWKRQRRIFAVRQLNQDYYPTFQFDPDGQPKAIIAQVLSKLPKAVRGWELALWFTTSNGWLDGKRPVDLLDRAPKQVLLAAEQESNSLAF
jgi:hypothetical protein